MNPRRKIMNFGALEISLTGQTIGFLSGAGGGCRDYCDPRGNTYGDGNWYMNLIGSRLPLL